MRLLLLNPNTSGFVTERVAAQARRCAQPGTEILLILVPEIVEDEVSRIAMIAEDLDREWIV